MLLASIALIIQRSRVSQGGCITLFVQYNIIIEPHNQRSQA
jgi:hypothetical protein